MKANKTNDTKRRNVLVYGSLLKGLGNHGCLAGANFVGQGATLGWDLHALCSFPAVVRSDNRTQALKGEVYSVDARGLARLDQLEGVSTTHPESGMYRRETVRVFMQGAVSGPRVVHAIVYVYNGTSEARRTPRVKDGDWRAYRQGMRDAYDVASAERAYQWEVM